MRNSSVSRTEARRLIERLNGRSSIDVYEAAKEIWNRDDPTMVPAVIRTLRHGRRVLNRAAAAYALNLMHGKASILALESSLKDKREHPEVRGQAAESLAHNHRPKSHRILLQNLGDRSKDVRFWCAYSLAEMGDGNALASLRELARTDHRVVKGFWSVSREAAAAVRKIRSQMRRRGRSKRCWFC